MLLGPVLGGQAAVNSLSSRVAVISDISTLYSTHVLSLVHLYSIQYMCTAQIQQWHVKLSTRQAVKS